MKNKIFLKVLNIKYKVLGYISYIDMSSREEWIEYILEDNERSCQRWLISSKNSGEIIFVEKKDYDKEDEEVTCGLYKYREIRGEVIENDNGPSFLKSGDVLNFRWYQKEEEKAVTVIKEYGGCKEIFYGTFITENDVDQDIFYFKSKITLDNNGRNLYNNIEEYEGSEEYREEKFRNGIYLFYGVIISLVVIMVWVNFNKYGK